MMPSNGKTNATLYEQVLDFARKEIEDASSQMEELRRALHLVEARVEAAKSVYESVAARLNLEDELEDEAQLGFTELSQNASVSQQSTPSSFAPRPPEQAPPVAKTPEAPPVFAPEPPMEPTPAPPVAKQPEPTAAPAPAPPVAQQSAPAPAPPEPPQQAPASQNNGASDGFSMDLIRKHLEARERAAQKASQAPAKRPETPPEPVVQAPVQKAPAPSPPAPPPKTETPAASQPAQGGFPGLSEADRALIGEYLRSKRD